MAYPEELLELAYELFALHPESEHQPSLRRSLSTAYYALFHLLIAEAAANWIRPEFRATLSRLFDHGPMRQASERKVSELNRILKENRSESPLRKVETELHDVAQVFIDAQSRRNEADYNVGRIWEKSEVILQIDAVAQAFKSWNAIRDEPIAQSYLVSMLASKDRRQADRGRLGNL